MCMLQVLHILVPAVPNASVCHRPVPAHWHHRPDPGGVLHPGLAHIHHRAAAGRLCTYQEERACLVYWWLLGPATLIHDRCH